MAGSYGKIKLLLCALIFFHVSSIVCKDFDFKVAKATVDQAVQNTIAAGIKNELFDTYTSRKIANEEDLLVVCRRIEKYFSVLDKDTINAIEEVEESTTNYLKGFIAIGSSTCVDFNAGFIVDMQNPVFSITFQNQSGLVKTREYQLNIWSIGLKIELAINLNFMIITGGASFNYYDASKLMHLGSGIEIEHNVVPGVGLKLIYCSIRNLAGAGILIFGIPIGLGGGISYIFGGTIEPVLEQTDS